MHGCRRPNEGSRQSRKAERAGLHGLMHRAIRKSSKQIGTLKPWETTVKWGCNSTPTPPAPKSRAPRSNGFATRRYAPIANVRVDLHAPERSPRRARSRLDNEGGDGVAVFEVRPDACVERAYDMLTLRTGHDQPKTDHSHKGTSQD